MEQNNQKRIIEKEMLSRKIVGNNINIIKKHLRAIHYLVVEFLMKLQ